jgi:antitoxin PrlF
MSATLKAESTLTDRYQTTVPGTVRRALQLRKRDKMKYIIRKGGEVVLMRATEGDHDDPVLNQLLDFLIQDIAANPEQLQAISVSLAHRLKSLVGSIDVDLNAPQSENDE